MSGEIYTKTSTESVQFRAGASGTFFTGADTINLTYLAKGLIGPLLTSTLSGFYNPRWRDQIRLGQNATTVLNGVSFSGPQDSYYTFGTDTSFSNSGGAQVRHLRQDNWISLPFPTGFGVTAPPSDVVTRVSNRVISRFISACQDATTAFESGQDAGEWHETLNSIHRPLASLHDKLLSYLDSLKKVKSRSRNKIYLSKALADTYLEFRFGWLPLADDVASAIVKCGQFRTRSIPVHASSREVHSVSVVVHDLSPAMGSGWANYLRPSIDAHMRSVHSLRYDGAVNSHADASGRSSAARELQLLPSNWLPTAWDLLPYSWIGDYFTNVGEIISALSFFSGDVTWGKKTSMDQSFVSWENLRLSWDPVTVMNASGFHLDYRRDYAYSPDNHSYEAKSFSRTPLDPQLDLLPRFAFRMPTSKYPYLNLGALLFSRASRLIPFF